MTDITQAQHLKVAAQQALIVLHGCLEHPDASDAISALQHAIAQPVITGCTEQGFMIDSASANELVAYDYAISTFCSAVLRILDGEHNGFGGQNEPWQTVRNRLLNLVNLANPQPAPAPWVMLTDEEILFAWNLRGKDGILGSLRDVETALIAKQEDKPAWPKEEQPDGSINEVDPFDMLARLDAAELDSMLLDWLDRELACPLTLHDGRYLNLGDKGVRQVISEAMKGKL